MDRSPEQAIVPFVCRGDVLTPPGSLTITIRIDASALARAESALARLQRSLRGEATRMLPWQRPGPAHIIDQETSER